MDNGVSGHVDPGDKITDWDEGRVCEFVASLGFPFYDSQIKEHGITGEILVHLDHEALKDIGIHSVGQRLAILKQVYLLKLQHNVPVEDGHYVPPSDDLEDSNPFETAIGPTASKHLRELISERDDRIRNLESEVQRLYDSVVTLQSEFLVRPSNAKTAALARGTPPVRSPTSSLFPHPLSNQATLGRTAISSLSRPSTAGLPDSPRSPVGSPHIPADAAVEGPTLSHMIAQDLSSSTPISGNLTPTTPTAPPYSIDSSAASSSTTTLVHAGNGSRSASSSNGLTAAASSSSAADKNASDNNPYRSFRVTLEDPCYKVLPAALKKYKIKDDWRQYALFICYGTTEKCLAYDEKPLILFQKLKESNANPVFMLRHIKDIKSPIAVSAAKHAARRDKRIPNAGHGLDKPPTVARDGSPLPIVRNTRLHHPPVLLPVGNEGNSTVNDEGDLRSPVSPREGSQAVGYCVAIYPYLAEREEEYDVNVGDTFVIINKTKGWWVVRRDTGSYSRHHHRDAAQVVDRNRCGWVPAGCLLETNVPPLSLADSPSSSAYASSPTSSSNYNASNVPIEPQYVVSVSTPGVALMDYARNGTDELDVKKGTPLRIFKRYNHWSYAIKEDGRRGWLPGWFCGKAPSSSSSANAVTSPSSAVGAVTPGGSTSNKSESSTTLTQPGTPTVSVSAPPPPPPPPPSSSSTALTSTNSSKGIS